MPTLQIIVDGVQTWYEENLMRLTKTKCKLLSFNHDICSIYPVVYGMSLNMLANTSTLALKLVLAFGLFDGYGNVENDG